MKNINLKNCGLVEMNNCELNNFVGGGNIMDLIDFMWANTPPGGSSSWTNFDNNTYGGSNSSGCVFLVKLQENVFDSICN